MVAGLSGAAFRAKALGVPSIGGWHYSPAGEERGVISRDNLKVAYRDHAVGKGRRLRMADFPARWPCNGESGNHAKPVA